MITKNDLRKQIEDLKAENELLKSIPIKKRIPTMPTTKSPVHTNANELRRDLNQLLEYLEYYISKGNF